MVGELSNQNVFRLFGANNMVEELLIQVACRLCAFSKRGYVFNTFVNMKMYWWLYEQCVILTICFSFLTGEAVIKDAFCIMSPGQAAKFNPLQ